MTKLKVGKVGELRAGPKQKTRLVIHISKLEIIFGDFEIFSLIHSHIEHEVSVGLLVLGAVEDVDGTPSQRSWSPQQLR